MIHIRKSILVLLVNCFCLSIVQGQTTITSSGNNASGSGGSVSYTIGQIVFNTFSGIKGSIAQGVQQPYEISIITAVENTEDISLVCIVYPNPTRSIIKLSIESYDFENISYRLFNINGLIIQDRKVESKETEISMNNFIPSVYFLKVMKGKKEIKTFKIIKN